jgi:hypothetical protein
MSSAVKLATARTVGVFFSLAGEARERVICPLRHPSGP